MKRILSLLVALAMVIAMIPNVFAAKDQIDMDELLGKLVYLDSVEEIAVDMIEGAATKTYKWTPTEDGVLTIYIYDEMAEGTELTVTMAQGDKTVTRNDEDAFELEFVAGTEVVITVAKTSEAALAFTMNGVVDAPRGSEENPITLQELVNQVTVTAEPTWFTTYFGGTTMTVTGTGAYNVTVNGEATAAADGVVTMPVVVGFRQPFVFTIDAAGEYTISFEYPVGTYENPEVLFRPNYIQVNIEEGNDQGYYYKWTSQANGELKLTCPEVEGVEYDVVLTNMNSYAMAWLQDSTDGTVSLAVSAGDEVLIQVVAVPGEDWSIPALQTALTGEFVFPVGTQSNPEILFRPNYIQVNVAEGNNQGYYYKWTSNAEGALKLTCPEVEGVEYDVILVNMSTYEQAWLQDSTDGTVSIDVKPGDEIIIQVATIPDGNWNYPALQTALTGEFVYPVGTQANPEALFRPQYIQVNVAEGNNQGYYYKWNSSANGTLTLTCPEVEGVEYDVILVNMSTYEQAWLQDSTDGTVSIDVKPGDEIIIQVVTIPDGNWNYPALQTALTGAIAFAAGDQMNPAQLVIGENTAEIAAGSQGYFYTWTAEANGNLTVTMPEGNWTYTVNNLTAGTYGDMQWSDSESVQNPAVIKVKAGDEIQLIVNTYDPADEFNAPAGTLVVTAAFEEVTYTPGNLDGNDTIDEDDVIYLLQHLLMPGDFPVDQPVDYDKNDVIDEDDVIYLLQHLLMPGDFPLA